MFWEALSPNTVIACSTGWLGLQHINSGEGGNDSIHNTCPLRFFPPNLPLTLAASTVDDQFHAHSSCWCLASSAISALRQYIAAKHGIWLPEWLLGGLDGVSQKRGGFNSIGGKLRWMGMWETAGRQAIKFPFLPPLGGWLWGTVSPPSLSWDVQWLSRCTCWVTCRVSCGFVKKQWPAWLCITWHCFPSFPV